MTNLLYKSGPYTYTERILGPATTLLLPHLSVLASPATDPSLSSLPYPACPSLSTSDLITGLVEMIKGSNTSRLRNMRIFISVLTKAEWLRYWHSNYSRLNSKLFIKNKINCCVDILNSQKFGSFKTHHTLLIFLSLHISSHDRPWLIRFLLSVAETVPDLEEDYMTIIK